jgi:hypothetical protein
MRHVRHRWRAAALLLVATFTLGWGSRCSNRPVERIEMRVRGDALERTVTKLSSGDPTPYREEREQELRKLYGKPSAEGSFRGLFRGELPADFGGRGALLRDATTMGRVVTYRERLRGDDSPQRLLETLDEGARQLHELTDGWIRAELGERPATSVLESWLRDRVVPDLRDLALYGWVARSEGLSWAEHEQSVLQFLVERDYFRSEDTPRLQDPGDAWPVAWQHALERGGVKLDPELEGALGFLDEDRAFRSLSQRMLRSQEFEAWLERAKDRSDTQEFLPLSPDGIAAFLAGENTEPAKRVDRAIDEYVDEHFDSAVRVAGLAIGGESLADRDSVEIFLELPDPPIESNGAWNPATRRVEWKGVAFAPPERDDLYRLPGFAFAIWGEPAAEFQRARFGRIALRGGELREYNRWYARLAAPDQATWDAFVATLAPGPNLVPSLERFRFPDESTTPDADGRLPESRAKDAVDALVKALRAGEGL